MPLPLFNMPLTYSAQSFRGRLCKHTGSFSEAEQSQHSSFVGHMGSENMRWPVICINYIPASNDTSKIFSLFCVSVLLVIQCCSLNKEHLSTVSSKQKEIAVSSLKGARVLPLILSVIGPHLTEHFKCLLAQLFFLLTQVCLFSS